MDLFNFQVSGYRMQDGILSFALNFVSALIFFLFYRSEKVLVIFMSVALLENTTKFLLLKFRKHRERVLILGENGRREKVLEAVHGEKDYTYVGYLTEADRAGESCLGSYDDLQKLVETYKIDKIVVLDTALSKQLIKVLLELKTIGIEVRDYFTFSEEVLWRIDVESIDERWLAFSSGFNIYHNMYQKKLKRVSDIMLVLFIFMLTLPLMLLAAAFIKFDSTGPVFFSQERIGLNGKPFKIFKFRSMIEAAEKNGPAWAVENDPRITKVGKFIRKSRIDELPQLWNILKGDMSFIGPRPERPVFVEKLKEELSFYNLRHSVLPGLTGWAQVMYHYGASIDEALHKLEYDLYYIKYQNFVMDAIIILKTLRIVVFGRGR